MSVSFRFWCLLLALVCSFASFEVRGEGAPVYNEVTKPANFSEDPVDIQLVSDISSVQPGHSFWVAVRIRIQDHWHTYWKNPGDTGEGIQVDWKLPEGFTVGQLLWPYPKVMVESGLVAFGYEEEVFFFAEVTAPKNLPVGGDVELRANVSWLACHDSCVPGNTPLSLKMPVLAAAAQPNVLWADLLAEALSKLPQQGVEISTIADGDGVFSLSLPALAGGAAYKEAYFFPETANLINYSAEQKISQHGEGFQLTVERGKKDGHPSMDPLHGILVLKTEKDGKENIMAVAVAAPLIPDAAFELQRAYDLGHEEMSLALAMFLAMIGGLILNLMPCVLPVIALKVMSFVKLSGENRLTTLKHGAAFFVGALVAFWILAGALLIFRAYGESVGWGFQLQSPLFVAILAFVLLVFGLSLFGVFEMGTSVSALAGGAQPRNKGMTGSFFSGVLATAVATPCTGPFLGTTVGFAVTLPAAGALLIFTAMGTGMALPYLVFAAFPALIRFLPKPGAWMVTFKELMGFVILATVLWLLWVFGAQTGSLGIMVLLAGFLAAAASCWVYGKWGGPIKTKAVRVIGATIALALLSMGLWAVVLASGLSDEPSVVHQQDVKQDDWIPFSPEKVTELRKKGIPVFVDFTAKWCLICQANKIVLNSDAVVQKFSKLGVVRMRADWTKNDSVITEELRKFGRNGVPLYLLYGPDAETPPQVLPQVLTPDVVISHVNQFDHSNIAQGKED